MDPMYFGVFSNRLKKDRIEGTVRKKGAIE
jgi:hypothetical protein